MSHFDDQEQQEHGENEAAGDQRRAEAPDNEYYHFLNVPRDADDAEIAAAFKRLARLYHPDKHLDPEKKKKAEMLFAKLKLAHEVLSDPHKRAIYDCLGKKGLKEQGWEIVQRTKTPSEIREEYERLAKERTERRLQQRTNPTSRLQVTTNATDLFERYLYEEEYDDVIESELPSFEVTEISFSQTVDFPITNTDNVVLSGNVSTQNGNGSGSIGCAWKRVHSDKFWHELDIGFGNGPHAGGKFFRRINPRIFLNMSGSMQLSSRGLKPSFNVSLGNQLSPSTVGYLTYSTNWRINEVNEGIALSEEESGMSTMLIYNHGNYRLLGSLQFGIPYTYVMLSVSRKLEETVPQNKAKGALKLGTFGAILEYGLERKVSEHSVLGATMVLGVPVGVTLRIRLTRGQQTYTFPLHLADELILQPIFYGTVTPLVTYFAFKKLILDPFEARRRAKERDKQMMANRARVSESRKVAEASIDLMKERFSRIRAEEDAKGGLVIVAALYGKFCSSGIDDTVEAVSFASPDPDPLDYDGMIAPRIRELIASREPEVTDVTIPVQCLVEENSRLNLFEGTKSELAGFFDPAPSLLNPESDSADGGTSYYSTPGQRDDSDSRKHLAVAYTYQRIPHCVVVADQEGLRLPRTSHRLGTGSFSSGTATPTYL